jgi:hypothetical protein
MEGTDSLMARRRNSRPFAPRPSVPDPRPHLLDAVLAFVRAARSTPGVLRIALLGSLATDKPVPKDADVLVTIDPAMDLAPLARLGRRLQGTAQTINLGADIFLADAAGRYLGRICHHRECWRRVACRALNCGLRQHLNLARPEPAGAASPPPQHAFREQDPICCSARIGGGPDMICSPRALPFVTHTCPSY